MCLTEDPGPGVMYTIITYLIIHIGDGFWRHPRMWWPVGISGIVHLGLFAVNVVYTILATLRTNEGEVFKYPITIKFIK